MSSSDLPKTIFKDRQPVDLDRYLAYLQTPECVKNEPIVVLYDYQNKVIFTEIKYRYIQHVQPMPYFYCFILLKSSKRLWKFKISLKTIDAINPNGYGLRDLLGKILEDKRFDDSERSVLRRLLKEGNIETFLFVFQVMRSS